MALLALLDQPKQNGSYKKHTKPKCSKYLHFIKENLRYPLDSLLTTKSTGAEKYLNEFTLRMKSNVHAW